MPYGMLPVLEIDGKPIAQSNAVARYLAREHNLAGKDEWESMLCDVLVDTLGDLKQCKWYSRCSLYGPRKPLNNRLPLSTSVHRINIPFQLSEFAPGRNFPFFRRIANDESHSRCRCAIWSSAAIDDARVFQNPERRRSRCRKWNGPPKTSPREKVRNADTMLDINLRENSGMAALQCDGCESSSSFRSFERHARSRATYISKLPEVVT